MFIPDQFSREGRGTEPNWFVDTIPTDLLHARRNTAAANTVVLKSSLAAGSRLAGAEFGSGIGESHAAPAAPAFVVRRVQGRPIWHRFAIRASDTGMSGCRHPVLAIHRIAATCRALRVRCSGGGDEETPNSQRTPSRMRRWSIAAPHTTVAPGSLSVGITLAAG